MKKLIVLSTVLCMAALFSCRKAENAGPVIPTIAISIADGSPSVIRSSDTLLVRYDIKPSLAGWVVKNPPTLTLSVSVSNLKFYLGGQQIGVIANYTANTGIALPLTGKELLVNLNILEIKGQPMVTSLPKEFEIILEKGGVCENKFTKITVPFVYYEDIHKKVKIQ